jgi:uncharacterized LabA/DUF88 family protein
MSVIQHTAQRVAVLIDTQNLYHSARNLYGARVNFGAVLNEVVGERNLIRAVAYLITTESQDEAQFFDALLKMGIETKSKDLQIFHSGNKKADWDVGITVDAIRLASKVDTIILATGDGDFVPLVEHLKSLGVQVEVVSFGRSASAKLKESTEAFLDLDEDPNKYLLNKTNINNRYPNQNAQRNNREERSERQEKVERTERGVKKPVLKDESVVKLEDGRTQESRQREADVTKPKRRPAAKRSESRERDPVNTGEARQD